MAVAQVHPTAVCDARVLGSDCIVAAFAHVGTGVELGDGCSVGPHAIVGADSVLGVGVVVAEAAVLAGGGSPAIVVGRDARIGANATIAVGVEVGRGAVVEPGTVVADGVPPNAIVAGNPARIVGYVSVDPVLRDTAGLQPDGVDAGRGTRVPGVEFRALRRVDDLRGTLAALEHEALPFVPRRTFTISGVPSERLRGAHAHRECWQFLVCLTGSLSCVVDDGRHRDEVDLAGPSHGLVIPPMVWGTQYRYTRDAVLLALASHPYDASDYIRDYDVFLGEVRSA